jgi:hypothetical protein
MAERWCRRVMAQWHACPVVGQHAHAAIAVAAATSVSATTNAIMGAASDAPTGLGTSTARNGTTVGRALRPIYTLGAALERAVASLGTCWHRAWF